MKKIILTIIVTLSALAVHAQRTEKEVLQIDTLDVVYKTRYVSSFLDNWYIQGNFGGRVLIGEEDSQMNFKKRIDPGYQFAIGKKFYPSFGARISGGGARLTGWNSGEQGLYQGNSWLDPLVDPVKVYLEGKGVDTSKGYRQEMKFFDINLDLTLDMFNIFRRYKRYDRPFDWNMFTGVGYIHSFEWRGMPRNNKVAFRLGSFGTYNITNRLGLNVEVSADFTDAALDGELGKGRHCDIYVSAFAGLSYKIGKQGFTTIALISPESYDALNNRVSSLRKNVTEAPIVKVVNTKSNISLLAPSVVFNQNTDQFDEELQMVNIFKIAKLMKENPDQKIIIVGNVINSNEALAEKRAKKIKDILVNKYSVSSDRLKIRVQDINKIFNVKGNDQSVNFVADNN
ncbi:MAG: hypothetical protein Q4F97_07320 [Bacteroidales bacterium]|nr:hypothetical protein [Bacteroidales bacterium]